MTVTATDSDQPPHRGERSVRAHVFALSDVGQSREHNEDTFLVAELESGRQLDFAAAPHDLTATAHGLLFLVADGMGGAASGELASSMAGALVLEGLAQTWMRTAPISAERFAAALRDATERANALIHQHAREYPEHRGMGTTATIAGLLGDCVYLVQVGDSRAYLVRDGQARQLTKDQSLMQRLVEAGELTPEEAEVSDRRNIILQALGPEPQVTVDLTVQQLRRGDTLILCSDGLSGLVKADEIAHITGGETDVRRVCRTLVDRANARGGPDNITVVAVRFEGEALSASQAGDRVGYHAYPLAGTLNAQEHETPTTLLSAEKVLQQHPESGTHALRPTSMSLLERRKAAVQPIFVSLAIVATAAVIWTVAQLLR